MAKAKNNASNEVKKEKLDKDITVVQFIKSWTPYVRGEVAGFDDELAEKLIKNGLAEE